MGRPKAKLTVPDTVAGLVRSLHPLLKKKVRGAFQIILEDPFSDKELKDELAGLRSLRIGRYRIIYRMPQEGQVEIVAVGSRERIYEETYRLIQKQKT
jgi:mRNA interferase RelE/StbE